MAGKENRDNNLVAKHARTFNKAHVMRDRKKSAKRGYNKHKGQGYALILLQRVELTHNLTSGEKHGLNNFCNTFFNSSGSNRISHSKIC